MWADAETDLDFLNFSEVAELVAELISKPHLLPLSVGIFGTWGTGKSSVLKLVRKDLAKDESKYLVIEFDAWLYQDFDDARAALMSVIAKRLIEAAPSSITTTAKSLYARINKLRLLGLVLEGGAAAMGVPMFGALKKGVQSVGDTLAGTADADDGEALKAASADVHDRAQGLINPASSAQPAEEITAFRADFGEVLKGVNKTLVVFIDNLDRCLPANAIHTLEAIRLFLFLPNTAFVIAADEEMIRHAVSQHFDTRSERLIADYLDKLIQVPVRVPKVGVQEARAYMFLLFLGLLIDDSKKRDAARMLLLERLQTSWRSERTFTVEEVLSSIGMSGNAKLRSNLEMADRMAPMLALTARVEGNPRTIKRLLNVVQMRVSIAKKRQMPIEETVIAKMALFERCTDESSMRMLYDDINSSSNGRSDALTKLEEALEADAAFDDSLPEPWKTHRAFIRTWVGLEPSLKTLDLRPFIYLARETVPLRIVGSSLSPAALSAINSLSKVSTTSSQIGKKAASDIDPTERPRAMEALLRQARLNPEWGSARKDMNGAVLLARESGEAAILLKAFILDLVSGPNPPWLRALVANEAWFKA